MRIHSRCFFLVLFIALLLENSFVLAKISIADNDIFANKGAYVGIESGWGWTSFTLQETPLGQASISDHIFNTLNAKANGGLLGGYAGYQEDLKKWRIGVEMNIDATHIEGHKSQYSQSINAILIDHITSSINLLNAEETTRMLANIRGLIGLPYKQILPYFTAGGAWRTISYSKAAAGNVDRDWSNIAFQSYQKTLFGYVIGGGISWSATRHWNLKLEYLYYGIGATNVANNYFLNSLPSGSGVTFSTKNAGINLFHIGTSYFFNT